MTFHLARKFSTIRSFLAKSIGLFWTSAIQSCSTQSIDAFTNAELSLQQSPFSTGQRICAQSFDSLRGNWAIEPYRRNGSLFSSYKSSTSSHRGCGHDCANGYVGISDVTYRERYLRGLESH